MFGIYDVQITCCQLSDVTWCEIRAVYSVVGLDSVFIKLAHTPMLVLDSEIGECLCLRTNTRETLNQSEWFVSV